MTTLTRRQLIGLVLLTLMWGLNWPIMKLSLRELPPLHFRALTMGLGALALAAYFGARGLRLWPRGAAEWRDVWVLGLPNILGWHALSIIGVSQLPAGRAHQLRRGAGDLVCAGACAAALGQCHERHGRAADQHPERAADRGGMARLAGPGGHGVRGGGDRRGAVAARLIAI